MTGCLSRCKMSSMGSIKPHHYILSDLHLGHEAILGYCRPWFKSIQEHDDFIINNIAALHPNDYLWLLGDIAFTKEGLMRLKEAKCHKGLIGGNHDNMKASVYLEVFQQLRGVAQMQYKDKSVLLTHIPMHPDQMRWQYNLHGHLHAYHVNDDRYINVSCEVMEFKPRLISEVLDEVIPRPPQSTYDGLDEEIIEWLNAPMGPIFAPLQPSRDQVLAALQLLQQEQTPATVRAYIRVLLDQLKSAQELLVELKEARRTEL
jgi:calcineurin-like phosphoesterase family protein